MTDTEIRKAIRGLTPMQTEAFVNICIGLDGGWHPRTTESLERKGLIESYKVQQGFAMGLSMTVTRYQVASIHVHMVWCAMCAEAPRIS